MRSMITAAALAVVSAAACSPALAEPFIEIGWEGSALNFSGQLDGRYGGRAVFDAAAAPTTTTPGFTRFTAVDGGEYAADASVDPGVEMPHAPAGGSLTYVFPDGFIEIRVGGAYLSINQPTSGFSLGMDSLPDDPASYAFAGGNNGGVSASGGAGGTSWSPGSGFFGGTFRYWIREVENPNPPEPCIADADGNGILDLSDVTLFAATFVAGCP